MDAFRYFFHNSCQILCLQVEPCDDTRGNDASDVFNNSNHVVSDSMPAEGQKNMLCDVLSEHLHDVGSAMFRDAGKIVRMPQIDDTKVQNSQDQVSNSRTGFRNPAFDKSHARNMHQKTFGSSSSIESQKRIHSRLKTQKCDVCRQSYIFKSSLTTYECIDTGEKLCVCHVCTKTFMPSSVLTTHRHCLLYTSPSPRDS